MSNLGKNDIRYSGIVVAMLLLNDGEIANAGQWQKETSNSAYYTKDKMGRGNIYSKSAYS